MKKSILLSAVVAMGFVAVQSQAATFTMTSNVDNAYTDTASFTAAAYNPTLDPATTGVVYEVPVYVQVSDLGTGQSGFGNVDITGVAGGSATLDSNLPYFANAATYGSGKTGGNYFAVNQMAGTSNSTQQEVVASISAGVTSASDPRYTMAQSSPFLLGWFYVDMPAGTQKSGTFDVLLNGQSTNDSGVLTLDALGTHQNAATINFIVPEPASLGLMGIGALGLLARRRRTA